MTDFGQLPEYAEYIEKDPFRRGLHYPAVEHELGDLTHGTILDVGCGDGLFSRLLAGKRAFVTGYDKAPEKIAEARAHTGTQRLGVEYIVATPHTFSSDRFFDMATSVMVLPFAASLIELTAFFSSARLHLGRRGRFVSVVLNPSFSGFGTDFFVRRINKLQGNCVQVDFLQRASGCVEMSVEQRQFTKPEYERAAIEGGMQPDAWKPLFASQDAVKHLGAAFWGPCHQHQPYALFVARTD